VSATPYDLILSGGRIVDGTGAPARLADVALTGDRVVAIGDLGTVPAKARRDVTGKVVAPGFIDVHTHDDNVLLRAPDMAMKVSQGVTTVVVGNCGVSLAPLMLDRDPPPPLDLIGDRGEYRFPRFRDYLGALDATPAAVNAACLVGHASLRVGAMDRLDRAATRDEIRAMAARLDEALDAGAVGMSTGLFYPPARHAPTEEVIELARVVNRYDGLYTTHMRDEGDRVLEALDEAFAIGRAAEVPVVISHHKVVGARNFGRSRETLARIEAARKEQPIAIDVYPYIASSTVLGLEWLEKARRIIVTWSKARPDVKGRDLADIAEEMGLSLAETARALMPAGAVYFSMDEGDVRRILSWPEAMIGSDGLPHDTHPHPRLWGTFPRVLGHYSREMKLFSLEEAVRRMTSLTADRFGLKDRGVLRVGAYADLVVFDPERVIDRATFDHPRSPAVGIELVLVNGTLVWRDGATTGARPGRSLRRRDLNPPMASIRPGSM
jgi:N-acyl-D-amino-acid deacylase